MLMHFLGSVIFPKSNTHFTFLLFIFILILKKKLPHDGSSELRSAPCAAPAPLSESPLLPRKHPATTGLLVSLESNLTGSTWIPPRPRPDPTAGSLSLHSYSTSHFYYRKLLQIASHPLAHASTTESLSISCKPADASFQSTLSNFEIRCLSCWILFLCQKSILSLPHCS